MKKIVLILCLILNTDISIKGSYNTLTQVLPYNDNDICFDEQWLQNLFAQNNITNVLEVGSSLGSSTALLSKLIPSNGIIYVMNSWNGFTPYLDAASSDSAASYEQFLSNMIHLGLQNKVIPIKTAPLVYSYICSYFNQMSYPVQLIYIHAMESTVVQLRAIANAWDLMSNGRGILCGNDWLLDYVKVAVCTFAQRYHLTVYAGDNFWFLKEGGFCQKSFLDDKDCFNIIL